jgi:hypothetical protein
VKFELTIVIRFSARDLLEPGTARPGYIAISAPQLGHRRAPQYPWSNFARPLPQYRHTTDEIGDFATGFDMNVQIDDFFTAADIWL